MTDRPGMSATAQWIVWFVLGVGNALLFGIGGVILGAILVVMAVLVASRGDTVSAVSGLLVGFGTTWLALIARQAGTGGHLDDVGPWLALGILPVALGVLLGVLRIVGRSRPALLQK